jgi:hypothetical protein
MARKKDAATRKLASVSDTFISFDKGRHTNAELGDKN